MFITINRECYQRVAVFLRIIFILWVLSIKDRLCRILSWLVKKHYKKDKKTTKIIVTIK